LTPRETILDHKNKRQNNSAIAVCMKNITKVFPRVIANDHVNLTVNKGEILALVGENGAGKTTLMNILYGLYLPDEGSIEIKGEEVRIDSPDKAIRLGMGMVHQHFKMVPTFTVTENITLGNEPAWGKGIFVDKKKARAQVIALSEQYGLKIDPDQRVRDIPVGLQQRVEILKTLYRKAEVLILDEPTAILTPQETRELFNVIRGLVRDGKTVIFITHKLKEVMEISDQVVVMRRGRVVYTSRTQETTPQKLANMMVGREVLLQLKKTPAKRGEVVLAVKNLTVLDNRGLPAVRRISFEVRKGMVLGIAGVEGNGQTELVEAITGLRQVESGNIVLEGREIGMFNPRRRRELGMAHIPEDRMTTGLNMEANLKDNAIVNSYYKSPISKLNILNFKVIEKFTSRLVKEFDIRTPNLNVVANTLSGGNLQKLVLARELAGKPKILVASQPTRGLDIGSIEFVHQRIIDARDSGTAVLLISAELEEILSLSDQIVVMYEGRIVGILEAEEADEETVGLMMAGIKPDKKMKDTSFKEKPF